MHACGEPITRHFFTRAHREPPQSLPTAQSAHAGGEPNTQYSFDAHVAGRHKTITDSLSDMQAASRSLDSSSTRTSRAATTLTSRQTCFLSRVKRRMKNLATRRRLTLESLRLAVRASFLKALRRYARSAASSTGPLLTHCSKHVAAHCRSASRSLFHAQLVWGSAMLMRQCRGMWRILKFCWCAELQPIPGLGGLIVAIVSQQKPMVAVTNSTRDNVALMLDALQLSEAFESVIYGAECAHAKPHPDPYLEGLKALGVPKERAIVFEDSPAGVASGVAAGLQTVALATTQSVDMLARLGASDVIADYRGILL